MKQKRAVKDAGAGSGARGVAIEELMSHPVMTATRQQSVGHVRGVMAKHGVHCMPVVNGEHEAIGIVTSMDLMDRIKDDVQVGQVMTRNVYTVPKYTGVHVAARMMRNHGIHHLVVTHEKKVVGLLSSFDLLRLLEDRRFASKNAPSTKKKAVGRRKKDELAEPEG